MLEYFCDTKIPLKIPHGSRMALKTPLDSTFLLWKPTWFHILIHVQYLYTNMIKNFPFLYEYVIIIFFILYIFCVVTLWICWKLL
jgi:hypothetical protein